MLPNIDIGEVRTLWQLGDWESINLLSTNSNQESCVETKIYTAAALYQLDRIEEAKKQISQLELTQEQKELAVKIFISGAYNSLGRAYICANNYEKAEQLCKSSLAVISNHPVSLAQLNARMSEQFSQLGVPRLASNIAPAEFKPDAETHFNELSSYFSNEPSLQVALAEFYQNRGLYDRAIVHWQSASSLLNAETPQFYYDRLKEAYKSVKGFPQGTAEQESLRGDTDKHFLLSEIHKKLQPEFYFEIGVQTGKSLALAKCEAIGVDPMPLLNVELAPTTKVITSSSDSFFRKQSEILLKKSIDLSFIDGMHLFEYALRDFINVEKYAMPHSLIVIDDIFPGHPDQAKRDRCTRAWTGDVWKVKKILEKYRPDLFILSVDAYPTGLLLISALNPNDTTFNEKYDAAINEYYLENLIPHEITSRDKAVSGKSNLISKLIDELKILKSKRKTPLEIKSTLEALTLIKQE